MRVAFKGQQKVSLRGMKHGNKGQKPGDQLCVYSSVHEALFFSSTEKLKHRGHAGGPKVTREDKITVRDDIPLC